jgi:chromosome segregation ATPase
MNDFISDLCDKLRAFAIVSKRYEFNDAAFFLEDQERHISVLERKLRDVNDLLDKADKQQDDLREQYRQLNSRVTKLMTALKPFSEAADDYFDDEDDEPAYLKMFSVGDLRAAHAAYLGEKND